MATDTGSGTKKLVIVESPSKATKIAGYLGPDYVVKSSVGHIRDLPSKADEVPAKYKGLKWARTGVNIDEDFEPLYVVNADKKKTIRELKAALAEVDELLLATDGDREGEAIAWHLLAELKPKVPVKRMVFHEITEHAITDAVKNTRDLDMDLVNAQETRRIVDRLYGFEVSPVLWRKVQSGSSAGRVQSVATRLVVDRERERIAFVEAGYWDLDAVLDSGEGSSPRKFPARLTEVAGKKVAQGRDFSARGELTSANLVHLDQTSATALATRLENAQFTVTSVTAKPYTRKPYAPFRTTTLQQEAGRKLHMSSQTTMAVAQKLYEGGYITYMRTDSVTLSSSAIKAARDQAKQLFGPTYVPEQPRIYTSKVKNAQEAHEAIRPAGDSFRTPAQTGLRGNELKLYELVWMRTVASQMKDATGESIQVSIQARPGSTDVTDSADTCTFAASGRTITFHGFLKAYVEAVDESDGKQSDDQQTRLPQLTKGQQLDPDEVTASGHSTRPPARYTEPSLVAKMEELEIGRPSTYASIINVIVRRNYVFKKGSALVPTWLAFAVTKLLEQHFDSLVDYDFTAEMEDTLDAVAKGDTQRLKVLQEFYFGGKHFGAGSADAPDAPVSPGLKALVEDLGEIDARKMSTFPIGDFDTGINLRLGQYGPYLEQQLSDGELKRANVPAGIAPDEMTLELAKELLSPKNNDREVGTDPDSGNTIVAKNGRFGPYVTEVLGEDAPKDTKPRTGSLFASMDLDTITLDEALKLINLPRVVGTTDDGHTITARNGPNGAYLSKIEPGKEKGDTRNLDSEEQIFTVTLFEALARFAEPKRRGRGAAKPPLKELGEDPVSGKPMVIKEGRFGPYVTDGIDNASLRRSDIVEEVTTARGAELLAERRAKGPVAKKTAKRAPAKKAPAKKAATKSTAKKTTAKKAAAKKAPAKKSAAKKAQ